MSTALSQARLILRGADRMAGVLTPKTCFFCHKFLSLEAGVGACRPCLRALPSGVGIGGQTTESGMRSFALLEHTGSAKALLHRFKITASTETAGIFRHLMRGWLKRHPFARGYRALIPIPSHRAGPASSQSAAYRAAVLLSELSGIPLAPLLHRTRTIGKQSASGRQLRLLAPSGSLAVSSPLSPFKNPAGDPVLLVDDVRTTGATAREAARVLERSGISGIDLFTLSRPRQNHPLIPQGIGI